MSKNLPKPFWFDQVRPWLVLLLFLFAFGYRLIGIGWPLQRLSETIPTDEWDIPLDAFASPEGLELFGSVD